MGLGSRNASRHETARTAGVDTSLWWDYKPGQRVMTVDGYAGRVTAVQDGPHPGNEAYEVVLDNDMGGGLYASSQLRPENRTTASTEHTAADDYPELGDILESRPDIAHNTVLASKTAAMYDSPPAELAGGPVTYDDRPCPHCGEKWVAKSRHPGVPDVCLNCGGRRVEWDKTAAENPWTTESHVTCPNCDSRNATVAKDGTTSCPDCGMGKTAKWPHRKHKHPHSHAPATIPCPRCGGAGLFMNLYEDGDHEACQTCGGSGVIAADGGGSAATTAAKGDTGWVTCPDCGFSTVTKQSGESCPLCEGQLTAHPDKYADTKVIDTRTASALEDVGDYDPFKLLTLASIDGDFRFHFTAAWKDVQAKAKRLRSGGQVRIVAVGHAQVAGEVKGDHHVYATSLQYVPSTQRIAMWECGCKWASYSWGRTGPWKRYEGRMCSHALALQYEAQSRGMFGQTVWEDQKAPQWLKGRTRVVIEYDKDRGENVSRPATPRKRDMNKYHSTLVTSPMDELMAHAVRQGVVGEATEAVKIACRVDDDTMMRAVAAAYRAPTNKPGNHPHGGPEVNADMGSFNVCSKCHGMGCAACGWDGLANAHSASAGANDAFQSIHPVPRPLPAGHQPSDNPAQSGFLTAPDPWFGHDERYSDSLGIDTAAALDEGCDLCGSHAHNVFQHYNATEGDNGEGEHLDSDIPDEWDHDEHHFDPHAPMHPPVEFKNPHYDPHAPHTHPGFEIPGVGPYAYNHTQTAERPGLSTDVGTGFEPDWERLHSLNALAPFPPYESLSGPVQGDPHPVPQALANGLGLTSYEQAKQRYAQGVMDTYAELNETPEPALPETDGTSTDSDDEQSDMDRTAAYMTKRGPMCVNCGPSFQGEGRVRSLAREEYEGAHCANCGVPLKRGTHGDVGSARGVEDIVAAFQRQANHLAVEGGPTNSSDIAQAAREALGKMALKDFTPAEQMALISEGEREGVTASNLDRLDIAGTHYEQIEAALAAIDDDDEGWMA